MNKTLLIVLGVAAAGAVAYFVTRPRAASSSRPASVASNRDEAVSVAIDLGGKLLGNLFDSWGSDSEAAGEEADLGGPIVAPEMI